MHFLAERNECKRKQLQSGRLNSARRVAQIGGAVALCTLLVACNQQQQSEKASEAPPTQTPTNQPAPAAAQPRAEFKKLLGRWVRPDGGYVLELKNATPEGQLEAGYFNPGPIHVAHAVAVHDSEGTRLLVELRDENYPGCIYRLKYDPQVDQLYGTYFQAAVEQTYDVTFEREK